MVRFLACVLALGLIVSGMGMAAAEEIKFDPPIVITGARESINAATVSYPEGDSPENNVWTRYFHDKYGIDLQYEWMVPEAQMAEKVNIMIASNDLVDIFYATPAQFEELYEAGQIADLTDVYEKYATDYTKSVMLESGEALFDSAKKDGRLMALPWNLMPKENPRFISVRADWEKQAGLNGISTYDDLVAYMKAFKNLQEGNLGFSATMNLVGLDELFPVFNANPKLWLEVDGKIAFGGIQPEVREALLAMQKLYAEGLLDPEFGTRDETKINELIASGKLGIQIANFGHPLYRWQSAKNNFPELELNFYPIPSIDGGMAKYGHNLGVKGYWVVSKNCTHPEAAVLLMNAWMDIFYANTEDSVFNAMVNDATGAEIWPNAFVQSYRGLKNLDIYRHYVKYINGEMTKDQLTPEERGVYLKFEQTAAGDNSTWCWPNIYSEHSGMPIVNEYYEKDWYVADRYNGIPTATMNERNAILEKLQLETYTKIIQGADISEFDNFVNQWLALGGEDITDELNAR